MPITANARRWGAGRVLVLASVPGARLSIVLYLLRRSRHLPRPRRGRGPGGGGTPRRQAHEPDTAAKRPKGKGRRRPGREGPAPADAGAARPTGPRRSEATPPRRAAPGRRKPHRPNQTKQPVLFGWRRQPPTVNKTSVLLGSSGGCRRRTLAAVRSAPNSRKKFRKTGEGVRQHGGVLRPPPMGDVRRETVASGASVYFNQVCVDFVCWMWYSL